MIKKIKNLFLTSLIIGFTSCGFDTMLLNSNSDNIVSIDVDIDISILDDFENLTISEVVLTFESDIYSSYEKKLDISTQDSNNINIDVGIESGEWIVYAEIYEGSNLLFYGQENLSLTDSQLNGFVDIELEPYNYDLLFPDYTLFSSDNTDFISKGDYLYYYDSENENIQIYNDNLSLINTFSLPGAITSFYVDELNNIIYLGFSSGFIRSLNMDTGNITDLLQTTIEAQYIQIIGDSFILVSNKSKFIIYNINDYSEVDSVNSFYLYSNIVFNKDITGIYAYTNYSPRSINSIKINSLTGEFLTTNFMDDPYHGNYLLGFPLLLGFNNSLLITPSGELFKTTLDSSTDMYYSASLGYSFYDGVSDSTNGYFNIITSTSSPKFISINESTFYKTQETVLLGSPKRIYDVGQNIIIFTDLYDKNCYRILSKNNIY